MNSAPRDVVDTFPGLVPELLITDLATSLNFWITLCGFEVLYDRPEEGFAYLHLGTAHIMLDQIGMSRDWLPATLERPLGRGVNSRCRYRRSLPWSSASSRLAGHCSWPLKQSGTEQVTQTPACLSSWCKTPTGTSFDSRHDWQPRVSSSGLHTSRVAP